MKNSIAFIFTLLLLTFNTLALEVELHSGDVSERTIWTKDKIHLITSDITVNTGIELTIEPGSVVKFYSGTRLRIYGALNAVGTAQEKIYFTSYRDDSVGGDTNGDDYSEGQAGDWVNIRFEDTVADSLTKLVFIEQRFAGDGEASIHFQGANVSVTDSVIRDSNNNGLYISDASPTLARNHIVRHKSSGIYIRSDSYPLIQGNVIEY
ncbi:MAG: right-handed parallel beta-helix repeat-containing protein, partial [Gammaproteobacteria bacterium]|nr:right-handed parallel beta-helix repeat-containing protein [Gammaproteobacteria bacterium]